MKVATVAMLCLVVACGQDLGRGRPAGLDGGARPAPDDGGGHGEGDSGTSADGGGSGDAGPPADAGASDAGAPDAGPTVCLEPAPSDICQSLVPSLGAPVAHRYLEVLDGGDGTNVFCGTGAYPASGSGVVLHPVQVQGRPPSFAFVDRDGGETGSFGGFSLMTFELDVVAQDTGFGVLDRYEGGMGDYGLILLDDRGVERGGPGFRQGSSVAALPGGGISLLRFPQGPGPDCPETALIRKWDETGSAPLPDFTDLGCYPQLEPSAIAGNASGNVLVLLGAKVPGGNGWDAIWLDADLRLLTKFTSADLASEPVAQSVAIAALEDGSFAIRFGGQWKYRVQPGATVLEPAPCWLASRPGTDLVPIRSGTAYAAIHTGSEECHQVVEVLTSEGLSCGYVGLDGTGGQCELAVGRDGTLSKSARAVDDGQGQPRTCVLEFWPAALGRTGY